MVFGRGRFSQSVSYFRRWQFVWVTMACHDSHTAVLCDWASRPSKMDVRPQPVPRNLVMCMIAVQESDQDAHIQKPTHYTPASFRSRSINSLVTMPPRFGNGRNPNSPTDALLRPLMALWLLFKRTRLTASSGDETSSGVFMCNITPLSRLLPLIVNLQQPECGGQRNR